MKTRRIWLSILGIGALLLATSVYLVLSLRPQDPHRLALKWEQRYAWLDVLGYEYAENTDSDVWAFGAVSQVDTTELYQLTDEIINMRRGGRGVWFHYADRLTRDVSGRGWKQGDWILVLTIQCKPGMTKWQQCAVVDWGRVGYLSLPKSLLQWGGRGT